MCHYVKIVCYLLGSIWVKSVWIKLQRVLEELFHSPSHIRAKLNFTIIY